MLAWMQGADAIEGDFRMTKDKRIVCMHDGTTGRTTNRNMVVARATYDSLRQLDAGGWMSPHWRGQTIPLLEDVLSALPEGKQLFLEIKAGVEMLAPLKEVLDQSPASKKQVILMAFDTEVLKAARDLFPDFVLLMLLIRKRPARKGSWTPPAKDLLDEMTALKLDGLGCCAPGLLHDHEFARQILASGKQLHTWTVNQPANAAKLRALGVASITTDKPGWIKRGMAERASMYE